MIADRYQPLDTPRPGKPLRARDLKTAQTVVLREYGPLPAGRREAALARARHAAGIFHPALVTLFDVTPMPEDRLLLAYEFVPAQSIRLMGGGQPLHPRRAAEVMSEIADAIAELHARGIVHGGISPQTVLVTMKGKSKLDRVADPMVELAADADEDTDLKAIISTLRELIHGGTRRLPVLDTILQFDDGAACGSAATLAASLRAVG